MLDSRLGGGLGLSECVNLGVSWRRKVLVDEIGEWNDSVLRMGKSEMGGVV